MATTLVSARVDDAVLGQSKRMLAAEGMTVSDAIRNMFEAMVATGKVVPWQSSVRNEDALKKAKELTAYIEGLNPTAPPVGWGSVEVDGRLLEEWRSERFGE